MIILKAEANSLFELNGLPELSVQFASKTLSIVTKQCGKVVVGISELNTGRRLTKQERKVMLEEVIEPFIFRHKATLKEYIKTKKEVKKILLIRDTEVERLQKLIDNVNIYVDYNRCELYVEVWTKNKPREVRYPGPDCTYTEGGVELDRMSLSDAREYLAKVELIDSELTQLRLILDDVEVIEKKHKEYTSSL